MTIISTHVLFSKQANSFALFTQRLCEKKPKLKYHSEASQLSDTTQHHIDFPLKGGRVFPSNLCSKAPLAKPRSQLQQTHTFTRRHRTSCCLLVLF